MGVTLVRPLTDGVFQRLTQVAVPQLDMLEEGWRSAYGGQLQAGPRRLQTGTGCVPGTQPALHLETMGVRSSRPLRGEHSRARK